MNLLYLILATFGLGFLVFVHEFGHYYMARKVGIDIEIFSIGFGKPLLSWHHNGVKWQICIIPFGGYVKMAGMEKDDNREPYEIPNGFFGKRPIDRIKVALAGPVTNIIFAMIFFAIIWATGGREKTFSELTPRIGWIDSNSELYSKGIRAGDEITHYDNYRFKGSKDHLYSAMVSDNDVEVRGYKIDQEAGTKAPFKYTVETYPHPDVLDNDLTTVGILQPAQYLIYNIPSNIDKNLFPDGSPFLGTELQQNDRLLWLDGEQLFSMRQLNHILNDNKTLLTIERDGKTMLTRVPRTQIIEYRLQDNQREELFDWQHASQLKGKLQNFSFIPYNVTPDAIVEAPFAFIDDEGYRESFPEIRESKYVAPLQQGDRIIAVDGFQISRGYELFRQLQERHVHLIIERNQDLTKKTSWKKANSNFNKSINFHDLEAIATGIGTSSQTTSAGNLTLIGPITPKKRNEFPLPEKTKALIKAQLLEQKKEIEKIANPQKRERALSIIADREEQLILGIYEPIDRTVTYNPSPQTLFNNATQETWRTLRALISGYISPKWFGGPIGIVHIMHYSWMVGVKEALFWIAIISLNLAILNLLPIPVLDGGHVSLALLEMITKKPLTTKTMERLTIPFVILLISFFIFLTYHDLSRLFYRFF